MCSDFNLQTKQINKIDLWNNNSLFDLQGKHRLLIFKTIRPNSNCSGNRQAWRKMDLIQKLMAELFAHILNCISERKTYLLAINRQKKIDAGKLFLRETLPSGRVFRLAFPHLHQNP